MPPLVQVRAARRTAPTTRLGKWAVGLVAAVVVLAVAVVTVVPEDSLAAWVFTFSGVALVVAAGFVLFAAIFRQSERALSLYAATLVLVRSHRSSLVIERKMLRGIKARAERLAAEEKEGTHV